QPQGARHGPDVHHDEQHEPAAEHDPGRGRAAGGTYEKRQHTHQQYQEKTAQPDHLGNSLQEMSGTPCAPPQAGPSVPGNRWRKAQEAYDTFIGWAEKRYPLPRTVSTCASWPEGCKALRRRRIWTSTVRSSTKT